MSLSDQWCLATGEDEGKPLIFRIRLKAPSFASHTTFPHLLVVNWPFKSPNDQGMPSPDDAQRMADLENLLQPEFETATCEGFLTVIVTGNGIREWQWYVRDRMSAMGLVNKTLGQLDPFPVQFSFQHDP